MTRSAPVTRYVYDFDEPSEGGRELLGGKGIGLAEMTAARRPGARRLHDHDRRLPRVHARGRAARRASRTRSPSTSRGSRRQTGQALRRHERPAARLGALGRGGLDARDDGHDPEPRPERRRGRGARRRDRQRALRARLVPAADPDVRRGRRRHRRPPLRARARRPQARARRRSRTSISPPTTSRELVDDVQGDLPAGDGRRRSRRTRASSCARAVRRSLRVVENPRAQVYRRTYDDPRRHRHGGQRRADGVRQQGRPLRDGRLLHARPVDRRARRSTASTSSTRRARTSSRASARRSRSRRCASACRRRTTSCSRR